MDRVPGENIIGVEVGVFAAQLSSTILPEYPRLKKLYGVDPYVQFTKRDEWPQQKWDDLYDAVQRVMAVYGDRWELIRKTSLEALEHLPDDLDFVYLDGDHSAATIEAEIPLYEKKVKNGGIICGHDYYGTGEPGVKPSVDKYAKDNHRNLQFDEAQNMWWWRVKRTSKSEAKRIAVQKGDE